MPVVGALLRERLQPFVDSHRVLLYVVFSILALAITTFNALRDHSNFFSVAIHLAKSSRSLLVLANSGMCTAFISGRILQSVFFGPLLPAEVERLYDRTWFFITESLLAFTIFRDDFDIPFGVMFGFLLFVKCFHWLLADRIEWMDQRPYPGPPPLFHIRALGLFVLLTLTDLVMLAYTVDSTLNHGISATLLFANEYAILVTSVCNAMAKYAVGIYELRRASSRGGAQAPPWEAKSIYIFYIELLTDFCKLSTYLAFFAIIMTFYGLPLNLIREVYITGHSFVTRLTAFRRYRTATKDMDERYPNATAEELSGEADQTCIICREEMVISNPENGEPPAPTDGLNMTPKKLPCGHIFHFHCLRSWLERQQNCPTCRRTVLETGAPQNGNAGQAANNGLPLAPQAVQGQQRPWGLFANQNNAQGGERRNARGAGGGRGLLARLLGVEPEAQRGVRRPWPPAAPGAGAPAPAPVPAAPATPAVGVVPGQRPPALVFEYNYVWDPNARAQRLMQPPMLQGFYREDGLWQGWPNGGQLPPERYSRPARANGTAGPGPSSDVASARPPTDTVTTPAEPTTTTSAPTTNTDAPVPVSRPMTPREAAAAAARRRFELTLPAKPSPLRMPSTAGERDGNPVTVEKASSASTTSSAAPTPAPNVVDQTVNTESAGASASKSTPPTPAPAPAPAVTLPTYIPLYDFAMPPSSTNGASQGLFAPSTSAAMVASAPRTPVPGRAPMPLSMPWYMPPRVGVPGTPAAAAPPLSALPRTMTDAELARLDVLTRDAIDARLRVLEDVNGAVNRCIDELLRMRSVLPAAAAAPTLPTASADLGGVTASASAPGADDKGKGKAVDPAERPNAWLNELNEYNPPPATMSRRLSSVSTVAAEPPSPGGHSVSSESAAFSEVDADEQQVDEAPGIAAAPGAQLAGAAASQLAALSALTSAGSAPSAAADVDALPAPGTMPPPPGQAIEVEPEAVPLAAVDPALEQAVGAQAVREEALPNVGGQGFEESSSSEEDGDNSEGEDTDEH